MKVPTRLITRISPKLNKSELLLSIILMDICKEPECKIGKAVLYKHPLMTSTIFDHLKPIIKDIVGKKIICDKYYDKAEEKYVLFEEISRDGLVYNIKFNTETFEMLKKGTIQFIDSTFLACFNPLSELRFVLWLKTWKIGERQKEIAIPLLKTYLNKAISTTELINVYITPIVSKFMKMGVMLGYEKIYDENDKRYISSLVFKLGN